MTPTFRWGRVVEVDPLMVLLDGDTAPLRPSDTLIDPETLSLQDRVRCEMSMLRLIVHGRAGGDFHFPDDTGPVDLSGHLASGFTGTLAGRRLGDAVTIVGSLTGTFPDAAVTDFITLDDPLPALWRPGAGNRWGAAYSANYSLNVTVRPDGTMGLGNRVGSSVSTPQFSLHYLLVPGSWEGTDPDEAWTDPPESTWAEWT